MSFKPIDSNRDEFRKYLERSGVVEALSKVLINLFHEQDRPENAVDYLRINIGDALKDRDTIESLKLELAESRREIDELKKLVSTSNTVTVQTNTDGGGDVPVLQTSAKVGTDVAATENVDIIQGKIDEASPVKSLTQQGDNTDGDKNVTENTNVEATDKEVTVKADNDETTENTTSNSPVENNEPNQSSPPVAATVVASNDDEPSKEPPKTE